MEVDASKEDDAPRAPDAPLAAATGTDKDAMGVSTCSPRRDAMDVDADKEEAPLRASNGADKKDVLCTVCALTLPPCLPCVPHPRLEGKLDVACCGVCADELEAADEEDDAEDACAWCDDGGELLCCDGCERAFCRACLARHGGASYLEQALNADVWDGPCCRAPPAIASLVDAARHRLADESDEEEDAERAEARLLAIESEMAAAQEAVETETVERQEAEIRGELAARHDGQSLDDSVAAELGEWTRLCRARLANCEREHASAQDRAERAGVDLRAFYAALAAADETVACDTQAWRRAPKLALRRNGRVREVVTGVHEEDESDDEVASYDGVEDETAQKETAAADAFLAAERPVKRRRGKDGGVKLDCAGGAAGFEAARKKELGEDVFQRVYASTDPRQAREDLSDIEGAEDDVDDLYEGTENLHYTGNAVTPAMIASAMAAEDAKQSRRPVARREQNDRDEDARESTKRRPKKAAPKKEVSREAIPRAGAACLVLVPARAGEPRLLQTITADGALVLGRAYSAGDANAPADYFAACPSSKSKISRSLVRIEVKDGAIIVSNLATRANQRVLLDGVEVKNGAPITLKDTCPLHLGSELVCKENGDVRAYIVTPTRDQFLLPVNDGFDFADDDAAAAKKRASGAADDPICLEGEEDLFSQKKKRKRPAKDVDDDDVAAVTVRAREAEKRKRERLASRDAELQRRGVEPWLATAPKQTSDAELREVDLACEDLEVATVALTEDISFPRYLGHKLKQHQVEACKFIYAQTIESLRALEGPQEDAPLGCVLAHSMGLGKSLTCIAYLAALFRSPRARAHIRTALVVCPTNVIYNWRAELDKWCERDAPLRRRVFVIDRAAGLEGRLRDLEKWSKEGGVAIIGYEMFASTCTAKKAKPNEDPSQAEYRAEDLRRARRCLQDPGPDVLVLDEAHGLKNPKSNKHIVISAVRTKRSVALTGTPLQNNMMEYHVMVSLVRGPVLGSPQEFRKRFADPIDAGLMVDSEPRDVRRMKRRLFVLSKEIKDFVLRRDETLLARECPGKTEYLVVAKLQPIQKKLYQSYFSKAQPKAIEAHMALLRLGNHPATHLCNDNKVGACLLARTRATPACSASTEGWDWASETDRLLNGNDAGAAVLSSKVVLFLDILSESLARGDKVVVFTQSLATLDYLAHVLQTDTWGAYLQQKDARRGAWVNDQDFFRIEGSDSGADRQRKVEAYEKCKTSARVFLLSTKAGNVGINLVSANRVVLFDTSWNPATDRQALFRCFRFGQNKHVYIYRLVAEGFEKRVYSRAAQKNFLALRVVDDKAFERMYAGDDLREALRLPEGPIRVDSASDDDEVVEVVEAPPEPPDDDVLAAVVGRRAAMVAQFVATDTLLVENDDERLEEGEEADAMDEYEREKSGRPTREEEERIHQIRLQRAQEQAQIEAKRRAERERAEREASEPLPKGWTRHRRPSDNKCYYHHGGRKDAFAPPTAHTVWHHPGLTPPAPWPPAALDPAALGGGLPPHPRRAQVHDFGRGPAAPAVAIWPATAASALAAALAAAPAGLLNAPVPSVAEIQAEYQREQAAAATTWPPGASQEGFEEFRKLQSAKRAHPAPRAAPIDLTAEQPEDSPALECVPKRVPTPDPEASKRTKKKTLLDLISDGRLAPGPIIFSWTKGDFHVRAEADLLQSGKILYRPAPHEPAVEYDAPSTFARVAFLAAGVDDSKEGPAGPSFLNGYEYLTMKEGGVRIKDLRKSL